MFGGCNRSFPVPEATVMEPSQVLGEAEKCISSSESGWTMYIGSQIHHNGGEDDDDNDFYFFTDKEVDKKNDNKDNESDDSMASDASSGPTLDQLPCGREEGRLRNHAFTVNQKKYVSGKEASKKEKKERRIKGEKQQSVHKADSAASQV